MFLTSMVRGRHIHESMSDTSSSSVVSERTERYCLTMMEEIDEQRKDGGAGGVRVWL